MTASETIALIARMKSCEHWEATSDCGCSANICKAGKGKEGIVNHADCFACLTSLPNATRSPE